MANYDFRVGDYVETKIGEVRYITELNPDGDCAFYWELTDGTKMYVGNLCHLSEYFKKIGKYDFTKPEKKNKIESLNTNNMNCASAFGEMHNKINEIINYINKENNDES